MIEIFLKMKKLLIEKFTGIRKVPRTGVFKRFTRACLSLKFAPVEPESFSIKARRMRDFQAQPEGLGLFLRSTSLSVINVE